MEIGFITIAILCDIIIFWRLVSLVYEKQWDVFSSKMIFSIGTAFIAIIIVSFASDFFIGKQKVMLLIFGSLMSLVMIGLNLGMFYLVRRMKYVEATIPLGAYQELKRYGGELKEDRMICLIPRKDIFDLDIFLAKTRNTQLVQKEEIKKEKIIKDKVIKEKKEPTLNEKINILEGKLNKK